MPGARTGAWNLSSSSPKWNLRAFDQPQIIICNHLDLLDFYVLTWKITCVRRTTVFFTLVCKCKWNTEITLGSHGTQLSPWTKGVILMFFIKLNWQLASRLLVESFTECIFSDKNSWVSCQSFCKFNWQHCQ